MRPQKERRRPKGKLSKEGTALESSFEMFQLTVAPTPKYRFGSMLHAKNIDLAPR
jgi:hypothetical protein